MLSAKMEPIDYERLPAPRRRQPPTVGSLSVAIAAFSVLATAVIAIDHHIPSYLNNELLNKIWWISCLALVIGIGGLFQPRGRTTAAVGICVSLLCILLIPSFHTA